MSFDALQDKIRARKSPIVVELSPGGEEMPPHLLTECLAQRSDPPEGAAQAAWRFSTELIDALQDCVPAVSLQAAGYERFGWRGLEVMARVIAYAKERGLFVIADAKRTGGREEAGAYAGAWLGGRETQAWQTGFDADCVSVDAYTGSDAVAPFLEAARAVDKCILTVVRTVGRGSGELQNIVAGDRVVYTVVGDLVQRLGRGSEGKYGYTAAGAMVTAPYPSDLRRLRRRLEQTFFLVYDSGEGELRGEDLQNAFDRYGRGAAVCLAGRVTGAWRRAGGDGADYCAAARAAALAAGEELRRCVTIL